jgi:hypothetical protein
MEKHPGSKKEKENFIFADEMFRTAYSHLRYVSVIIFRIRLRESNVKCQNLKTAVTNLAILYSLNTLLKDVSPLFEAGYFS